jgi:hypothetical protein
LNWTRSAGAAQTSATFSERPQTGNTGKIPKTAAKKTAIREPRDILNDPVMTNDLTGNPAGLRPASRSDRVS